VLKARTSKAFDTAKPNTNIQILATYKRLDSYRALLFLKKVFRRTRRVLPIFRQHSSGRRSGMAANPRVYPGIHLLGPTLRRPFLDKYVLRK
jgi:hypothetical protein